MSVCLCSVLCLSTDPFAPGQSNGLVIASFMKNKCAVVYNTILHELHFSHCHNGEGKAKTAKDVASFTPLLPSFCYLKSRWVRRKAPLFISPEREQSTAMLSCQAFLIGTRCSSSSELSSSDTGSSPQPWGSAGCCSHTKTRGKPHYHSPACASHNGEARAAAGLPSAWMQGASPGCTENGPHHP